LKSVTTLPMVAASFRQGMTMQTAGWAAGRGESSSRATPA